MSSPQQTLSDVESRVRSELQGPDEIDIGNPSRDAVSDECYQAFEVSRRRTCSSKTTLERE